MIIRHLTLVYSVSVEKIGFNLSRLFLQFHFNAQPILKPTKGDICFASQVKPRRFLIFRNVLNAN